MKQAPKESLEKSAGCYGQMKSVTQTTASKQVFATRSSISSNARTLVKKFFPRSAICNIQLYIQQYAAIDSNI